MHRRDESNGFTLIEAAVAIAVVAILAGAIAPLAVKAINQQREFRTRESLKAAFEGMFGARDRRVANMRADFGWNPQVNLLDLSAMVVRNGTNGPGVGFRNYVTDATAGGMYWGYNGPYWNGATNSTNGPLDGWGNPMKLQWVTSTNPNGWQVLSRGQNGQWDTVGNNSATGDDIGYPTVPATPISFTGVLNIIVMKVSSTTGTVDVQYRNGTGALVWVAMQPSSALVSGQTTQTFTCNPIAGGVYIRIIRSVGIPLTLTYVLDISPGEVRQIEVAI